MQARAQASKQKAAGAQPAAATAPTAVTHGNEAFRMPAASQPEPAAHPSANLADQHQYQHVSSHHNGSWQNGHANDGYLSAEQAAGPTPPAWNGAGADAADPGDPTGEACNAASSTCHGIHRTLRSCSTLTASPLVLWYSTSLMVRSH